MKKQIQKSISSKNAFAKFAHAALSNEQQKKVKGGDDIIIVDVIEG